jgi:hypothetical protein
MELGRLRRMPRGLARRARAVSDSLELRRFHSRIEWDPAGPILLLSPHWDDAVFNCWSLLTSERDVRVINVFGGVPPPGPARRWDVICGGREASEHVQARIAEDAEALAQAGRAPMNLPLLDAEYREPGPDPALSDLDAQLRKADAAASAVYAPAALGMNVDHRLVRRYARALHRQGMPVHLYADLPYCVVHGWPDWVDGTDPDPHRDVDAFWWTFLAGVPELDDLRAADVARIGADAAAQKLSAMRAYDTQFAVLDGGRAGLLSNPAIHGFEVAWALKSPDRS